MTDNSSEEPGPIAPSSDEGYTPEERRNRFQAVAGGTFLAVIIYSVLMQPVFSQFDPADLALFAGTTSVAAALIYEAAVVLTTPRWRVGLSLVAFCLAGFAAVHGTRSLLEVVDRDEANQDRCAWIEADMLSKNPLRADGPDLFSALKCRTSTANGVSFKGDRVVPHEID